MSKLELKVRPPRPGAVHPCPGCICPGNPQGRAQCLKIVPARTYSKAHRCEKFAATGSPFCSIHGGK